MTPQENPSDNFSEFLSEYQKRNELKYKWVDEQLQIIPGLIQSILNVTSDTGSDFKSALDQVSTFIKDITIDPIDRINISLDNLIAVFNKYPPTADMLLKVASYRKIVNVYINIARYTSDERIAKKTIDLGKVLLVNKI